MPGKFRKTIRNLGVPLLLSAFAASAAYADSSVGGTVAGLNAGDSVTLLNDGVDALKVSANGNFTFHARLVDGGAYDVTIDTQPSTGICKVSFGTGLARTSDVNTVRVDCHPTYSISGNLTGLKTGESVTLLDDFRDALTLAANGKFTFAARLASRALYEVTVRANPVAQACVVRHGLGRVGVSDVSSVDVSCSTAPTFTIGGTVGGLGTGESVTLLNNGADEVKVARDGNFKFPTSLDSGARYDVTVGAQPADKICRIGGGAGIIRAADVTAVRVDCIASHNIGGTLSGLETGESVTLLDNRADPLTLTADGKFKFAARLALGDPYSVSVETQPTGARCAVSRGRGRVSSDVSNIAVTCDPVPDFTIGGQVSGLNPGESLTLLDNGADPLTINKNEAFTFSTRLNTGSLYDVTIETQPAGNHCTVFRGRGLVKTTVTNVEVSCNPGGAHRIGGTVSGLKAGDSVTLLDNGGDALKVAADGKFTFATSVASGSTYDVTIGAQSNGEICAVANASGKVAATNVTNVTVLCVPSFTIGGTVFGLSGGASLTLLDNGADSLTVTANGTFTFKTALAGGDGYNVTIATQPAGETCSVSRGSGTVASANVTSVDIECKSNVAFTVGGTVSGLTAGTSVTLLDDGGDALPVGANGAFTFKTPLAAGAAYKVTVATQPSGETCTVANGSGTVGTANVTNVTVSCAANTFTIGGTLSGLNPSASIVLLDNKADALTLTANGSFTFKTSLPAGAAYGVTVGTQPTGETCTVSNGSGTVGSANVTNVAVSCVTNMFTIGGTVSGLNTGASLTLLDNGADSLTVGANGAFTFKTTLATGTAYRVTVAAQPSGETCTVANGSGTVGTANVTNVAVACTTNMFTIGGTVSGLSTGASVTLLDNGADSLTVSANGAFTFKTALATGAAYGVTVGTQPSGETCSVSNGTGTVGSANVTNVAVSCATNTFTIGGTVSGLNTGASVTLLDNGGDSLAINANGAFTFKTALATGAAYSVTVGTQPTGETCTVSNGTGTVGSANVTNVAVSCAANTFAIGGMLSGLSSGASITLLDNGTDSLTLSANGSFTFKTALASGTAYNVTIGTQPTGETCTVSNGSGTVAAANVTNVGVSCVTNTFTIGGTVSGLTAGASVTLLDNGGDSLTVNANGAFTFNTALAIGAAYSVTVGTQPNGETCTVSNASGTVAAANVTNVSVSCSSGNGGGSGTFWIPYTALPFGTGGSTGLFVLPSDKLESSPGPQFVTTAQTQTLGFASQFTTASGAVVTTPALLIYAAVGGDGNRHVYGLKLSDTSGVPAPTQISSLSLPPTQQICSFAQAQTSLADPTTVFTVLDVAPNGSPCGTAGDTFELIHYKDSANIAPTVLSINTTLIFTLYQDGSLTGLILYDAAAQSLNLYADSTFTSPVKLLSGASSVLPLREATLIDGTTFGGTVAYFNATGAAGPGLYRIDSSSLALTLVHQGVVFSLGVPDRNNLYFTDVTSSSTTVFYQVPLAGGAPMVMFSAPYTAGLSSYLPLGTNDSVLAFQFMTALGSPAGTTTNTFYTIPIGVASTTATTIGGPYVGNVNAFAASPTQGDFANSAIFVTILNKLNGVPTSGISSVAIPMSGSSNTTPVPNAAYPAMGPNAVIHITGITDTGGGEGGGTLSNVNITSLQDTPITTTGGAAYTLPAGYVASFFVLGSNIAAGDLTPFQGTVGPALGVAIDLSKNFVLPLNLFNTNVSPF